MADSATAVAAPAVDPNPTSNSLESDSRLSQPDPSPTSVFPFPNPSPGSHPPPPPNLTPPLPSMQPSSLPVAPQFPTIAYQTPPPGVLTGSTTAAISHAPLQFSGMTPHYAIAGQPVRYAPPMPNSYPAIPQGVMPPPGVLHYPSPYGPMIRPAFPPRPLVGVMPQLARPPIFGIRGPIMPPGVRPAVVPIVIPVEKPQTTVYIGKISTTVENEFMLSLLQLCGPVKNWKRPQDPTGTLKGFGFCEFEFAEGVLRALRLLNKLNVDGQELMVNVNQSTREYLERFVAKKSESSKNIEESGTDTQNEEPTAAGGDTNETMKSSEESLKPSLDEQKRDDSEKLNKNNTDTANVGLVNNKDREADHEALKKLREMLEERLKSHPLPPPPPPPLVTVDASGNSNSEQRSVSRDRESDEDIAKNDSEDKNEEATKPSSKNDRTESGSPDKNKRNDRPRDRDYEQKREKERELERYEKEREQERFKREKDREYRNREDERRYKVREKDWEAKERERDHWRKREREREKERAQERKWEIIDQERDNDDNHGKKRKYKTSDEERKQRQREKEDDVADRLREAEEILEAKMKAEEEQKRKLHEALNVISGQPASSGFQKDAFLNEINFANQDKIDDQTFDHKPSRRVSEGEGVLPNVIIEEPVISSNDASDTRHNNNGPTRKLGFGLTGSGKRAAVPSVFNADEDEEAHKDKKMRPLVPIDYTTEEQNTVEPAVSEFPPANVVAVTEFVKHISNANAKEEKPDVEKEKSRRSNERSSQRDRGRHEEETNSTRGERDRASKKTENPKLLDAKQLIDTIPKTKNELFTYEINWVIYEQNALHERLRPWIAKKITDFLGEEEVTLVDYIVSSTQEHVDAGEMLERLQTILDDEAEMFVLKMWRMLIFEIKKVETGLTPKLKT